MLHWLLDTAKIAIPVVLGLLVWAIQSLAQRAWSEYERRRELYLEAARSIDALLSGGGPEDRKRYFRAIRSVWIGGSDGVVRAANLLASSINTNRSELDTNNAYQRFILEMRSDLQTRRWLPPGHTLLETSDFPIQGPD